MLKHARQKASEWRATAKIAGLWTAIFLYAILLTPGGSEHPMAFLLPLALFEFVLLTAARRARRHMDVVEACEALETTSRSPFAAKMPQNLRDGLNDLVRLIQA